MTGEVYRLPADYLIDRGYLNTAPANNAPHWLYGKGTDCTHTVELPIHESYISCPICASEHETSLLKRIYVSPNALPVWHEFYCPATGRVESDRRRMEQNMAAHSDKISADLGIAHNIVRTDYHELWKLAEERGEDPNGKSVHTGLKSQHDTAVAEGRKESRGRFVTPVRWTPPTTSPTTSSTPAD